MQVVCQLPQHRSRRTGIKLEKVKCWFCREAKQKCKPNDRQWPDQKCGRCLDKKLPCSEGQYAKRTARIRKSSQSTEMLNEPQIRAIESTSNPIMGMSQPQFVIDVPVMMENTAYLHDPAEESIPCIKESLILLSIHTVLMLALQELKALGNRMWSISRDDPYHRTPASSLPELESIFSSYKSFACDLTTRMLRIGAGQQLVLEAYAALETDYSQQNVTWNENDAPQHIGGSVARFQELGHHGFAHVLHMKRLVDRPKLTEHEAQLLAQTRGGFLAEARETLDRCLLQEPIQVPIAVCNTQMFIPSRFLNHPNILESVCSTDKPDCLGRSISHILSDAGHPAYWPTDHIHHLDALGRSCLHIACQNGDEAGVQRFILLGADVYQRAMNGLTPFHIAACMGHTTICVLLWNLYERKEGMMNPDVLKDRSGRHPLLWAALCGRHETVARIFQLHLMSGLDSGTYVDDQGCTAVMLAACGGHAEVVRFLLRNHFPADAQDSNGRTAFWYAAQGGHEAALKLLCKDSNVDHYDKFGRTPLAEAARRGQITAIKYLLSLNQYTEPFGEPILIRVDPDSRDTAGKSALVLAAENGHSKCVKSLLNQEHEGFWSSPSLSRSEDMRIAVRIAMERQDSSTLQALSRGIRTY